MSSVRQKPESARGGRSKTSPCPDVPVRQVDSCANAKATSPLDADLLKSMMDSLKSDIFGKLDLLSSSLRSEITSVRNELKESIDPLQKKVEQHELTVQELERAATDHSGRITELEAAVSKLTAKVKHLDDRCEDLEGRSRRNNIRLVGLPEGSEGPRPTEFIAKLLKDLLGLDERPMLDRAHRTLRDKPKEGESPRPFVVRVHYFQTRNEILRRAGEIPPLYFQGKRISIFADYTPTVAKKRAAFGNVKRQLRSCPGIKFGLLFPATLKITLPSGDILRFDDPSNANDYFNKHLKKVVVPDDV